MRFITVAVAALALAAAMPIAANACSGAAKTAALPLQTADASAKTLSAPAMSVPTAPATQGR
jgi:hypothetical protein